MLSVLNISIYTYVQTSKSICFIAGSSKRSRSVPARPPVTNSPTWQQQQQQQQSLPVSRQQLRGRLVRDLHDPTLWKSEEDVCCTSLLCCRLLDFY